MASELDILNPVSPRNPAMQILSDNTGDDKAETKYIEGAEIIPLPSKGVFYTWDKKYWNIEELQVRQLNYTDEDILTTKQYFENGTIFLELLKNVIVDPNGFPATGLVPIDRDTILLYLRNRAFGKDFAITYVCPKCSTDIPVVWDISKLELPIYDPVIYEELKENGEYKITAPLSSISLRIIVPTIGKSFEAEKRLTAKKTAQKSSHDFFGTGSLMLLVSAVESDGRLIRDKQEIEQFFKKSNLPLSDARWIRKQIEKISLSYDTKQDITCQSCSNVVEGVEMPIVHPNFFWPDTGI